MSTFICPLTLQESNKLPYFNWWISTKLES